MDKRHISPCFLRGQYSSKSSLAEQKEENMEINPIDEEVQMNFKNVEVMKQEAEIEEPES